MQTLFRKAKEKRWSCEVILPQLNTEKWSYIWPKCYIILAPIWEVQVNLSLIGGVKGYLFEMLISKAYASSKSLDLYNLHVISQTVLWYFKNNQSLDIQQALIWSRRKRMWLNPPSVDGKTGSIQVCMNSV